MDNIKVLAPNTKIISDGGYTLLEVDNTYNAFLAAANRNYDGIKCDIRFTKDRKIITTRKRDLQKLTNEKVHVSLLNYDEIKEIKIKNSPFTHIPLLDDFLSLCKKYHKIPIIELKPPIGNIELSNLLALIKKYHFYEIKIIANDIKYLKYIRSIDLDINLELIAKKFDDQLFLNANKYRFDINLPAKSYEKDFIDLCHEYNIKMAASSVDNFIYAQILIQLGIDYIYTKLLDKA